MGAAGSRLAGGGGVAVALIPGGGGGTGRDAAVLSAFDGLAPCGRTGTDALRSDATGGIPEAAPIEGGAYAGAAPVVAPRGSPEYP